MRQHVGSASPPAIKTGSPMVGCQVGMRRKSDFGRASACSLME